MGASRCREHVLSDSGGSSQTGSEASSMLLREENPGGGVSERGYQQSSANQERVEGSLSGFRRRHNRAMPRRALQLRDIIAASVK